MNRVVIQSRCHPANRKPRQSFSIGRISLLIIMLFAILSVQRNSLADVSSDIPINGLTRSHREALLSASSSGRVETILVREGAVVREGDVLIRLDRNQEELERDRRRLLWESEAEIKAASARMQTASSELESTRSVFESTRAISRENLERKELEFRLAEAEYLRAKMNKDREHIEYQMATEALIRREIRAPMDGIVTQLFIEEGEGCELRQPLVQVVDASRVEFVANVEAPILSGFTAGQDVLLEVQVSPDLSLSFPGVVSYVAPVVDGASGLGVLMAEFCNSEGLMLPGVSAVLRKVADDDE